MDPYIFHPTVLIKLTILQEVYRSPRTISSLNMAALLVTLESLVSLWSQVSHWPYNIQVYI